MKGRPSDTFSSTRHHLKKGAMDHVEWSPRHAVGIAELDAQHREIFRWLNDISSFMFGGSDAVAVRRTAESLAEATKTHFTAEERKMRAHGYPGYPLHKTQHDKLFALLDDLRRRLDGGALPAVEVMTNFKNAFLEHVVESDQGYSDFLKKRGVR